MLVPRVYFDVSSCTARFLALVAFPFLLPARRPARYPTARAYNAVVPSAGRSLPDDRVVHQGELSRLVEAAKSKVKERREARADAKRAGQRE